MRHLRILILLLVTLLSGCVAGAEDSEMGSFYAFTKANPGTWSFGEVLTSSQQNLVDDNAAKCTDTFPVPITFEDDVSVQGGIAAFGPVTVDTDVTAFFGGPVTCDQTLDVNGDFTWYGSGLFTIADAGASAVVINPYTQFNNQVAFNDFTSFAAAPSGFSFQAYGKTQFDDLATFTQNISVTGSANVSTNLTVGGIFTAGSTSSFVDKASTAASGRFVDQVLLGTDANLTIDIFYREVYVPAGTYASVNRTYSLPAVTGADDGERCRLVSDDTNYITDVVVSGGPTLANLSGPVGFGRPRGITAVVIDGVWRVMDHEYYP